MSTLSSLFEKFAALLCPTGAVIFVMRKDCPEGFLIINGQKVYQTDYPRLYTYLLNLGTLQSGTDETGAYVTLPPADGRFFEATTKPSKVGTLVEAGLPNIIGNLYGFPVWNDSSGTEAFSLQKGGSASVGGGSGSMVSGSLGYNASWVSDVYGKSATNQPPSVFFLPCIKL